MKNIKANIGIVLLAAGASSRLGRPKQLLAYGGQTFLGHAMQQARGSGSSPIVLVLGSNAESVKEKIDDTGVHVVVNREWEEGMASSIRSGVSALLEIDPDCDGVILMVCDQPYVSGSLLNDLITTYQNSGKLIVASGYENTFGPPALFHKSTFPELLQLKGDVGARKLVQDHAGDIEVVPFPQGNIDIDTDDDYRRFMGG